MTLSGFFLIPFSVFFLEQSCLAIVTENPSLRSELGNRLAAMSEEKNLVAMAAIACKRKRNNFLFIVSFVFTDVEPSLNDAAVYKVSLRSLGDVDTTILSKKFGGGGHANASSFKVAKQTFDSWRKKSLNKKKTKK